MKCPLSHSSRQNLARTAIFGGHGDSIQGNSLLGYLKSEVHVGTACVGVGVLVRWCEVVGEGEQVPSTLVEHIKVHTHTHAPKHTLHTHTHSHIYSQCSLGKLPQL